MLLLSRPAGAADLDATAIRAYIDGVYILEEWNTDAGAFRPPKVDGRLVFFNGNVVFTTRNAISDTSQITSVGSEVMR